MQQNKIYDLPTRLLHIFFGVFFVGAYYIGNTIDDEELNFAYHSIIGILLFSVVILRIIWGIIGTRYALFKHFPLNLKNLPVYFKSLKSKETYSWIGHNPASAWGGILMYMIALIMGITGILMITQNGSDFIEETHEILANVFLVLVITHLLGLIIHSLKYKDKLAYSMVTGLKTNITIEQAITSNRNIIAVIFFLTISFIGITLLSNLDYPNGELNLFGRKFLLIDKD
jgi:cytochrome b